MDNYIIKETGSFRNAAERLLVFLPTESGFIRYEINHYISAAINADSWGIAGASAVDASFGNALPLTTKGEWEAAVRLDGRPDFSGGIMHGDEIMRDIEVIIDGKGMPVDDLAELTAFDELCILETSVMYDPNDSKSEIADHRREYIFGNGELRLKQSLTWKAAEKLSSCYMAMFTPAKSVTDTLYTDIDPTPAHIPSSPKDSKKAVKKVTIYSEAVGFTADFGIGEYPLALPGGNTWLLTDNGGGSYNKMYYRVCSSGMSAIGEVWKTETFYRLAKCGMTKL